MCTVDELQHPHILRLEACCMDGMKVLVYEYMVNGDVDQLMRRCKGVRSRV